MSLDSLFKEVTVFKEMIRPAIPQSEVLAKFVQEMGEKYGEDSVNVFADFRPSIHRPPNRPV